MLWNKPPTSYLIPPTWYACHSERSEESPTDSDYFYKHGISIVMHQVVIPTGTKWSGGIPYYAEGAFIQKHSIY